MRVEYPVRVVRDQSARDGSKHLCGIVDAGGRRIVTFMVSHRGLPEVIAEAMNRVGAQPDG